MKVIVNPNECAYQSQTTQKKKGSIYVPICNHNRVPYGTPCTKLRDFPDTCPLQDGIVKEKECFTDLCPYLDQKIPLIPKYKTDTPAKIIKRLKRRNRKNCIYGYIPNKKGKLPLHCRHKDILYPHCQGVNCGCFETKKLDYTIED